MTDLLLDVRLDGYDEPIGSLYRDDRGALHFAYSPDYAARVDAVQLSLSLPIADAPGAVQTVSLPSATRTAWPPMRTTVSLPPFTTSVSRMLLGRPIS